MTTFEQYLENLMGMKKAEIINEGITWGCLLYTSPSPRDS